MNYRLEEKYKELKRKYPELVPGNNRFDVYQTKFHRTCPPVYGIIVDNKDPDCLGRVRVQMDMISPGCVGPWYETIGAWKKEKSGWWKLPAIGTQVLVCFPYGNHSQGLVLGCIYDQKHLPPEHDTENPSKSILLQTKAHRVEIIDEDGKEEIRFESSEGAMRALFNKNGIQLINELEDGIVDIKCKELKLHGKSINLASEKTTSISTDGSIKTNTKGKYTLTSDKEIKLKGKNIKLSGSKGVATEGKQIATKDDKVMGMDIHTMVIPAGMSTANVPLPHPFIGKINDKVSDDVKIKDKGVAVKGSKAKHDDSMHMQLPGTIKFQSNPKKEGEVTGGTGTKVKVNGKEVAVIGSMVTTCNDMGMQNNSTIIAVGASIPMPAIINPKNTEEFNREREEQEKLEPAFQNVKWGSTSVEEGEEAELSAGVKDIADGNMVTLMVFPEGKGPEVGGDIARFPLTVKDGAISAKWSYSPRYTGNELPPESNPKFIFSAHCAWCPFEKSSNSLEVKLIRPEIKKVEWQDKDGNSTSKGLVGETLKLHAETKDMEGGVTFHIYDDKGHEVDSIGAKIEGDKADAEWNPIDNRLPENTSPLKYTIEATANRCKAVESGECQIKNPKVLSMEWDKKAIYYGNKATLKIKTFELSEESPTCKLQLWEKDYTTEDDFILEQDITIDSDEVEQEIEFNFNVDKVLDEEIDGELEVFCRLIYNEKDLAAKIDSKIIIRTEGEKR